MDKIKLHIPTISYGFIEVEREFALEDKEKLYKEAVEDFRLISKIWKEPETTGDPQYLGQTMVERGHTYKAVQNLKTNKLYWLIDKED